MGLLGIGIFNNVVISKLTVSKSDAGLAQSVDITFQKRGATTTSDDSLDFLSSGEVASSDGGKENNIRIYGASLTDYQGGSKTGDDILNEVLTRQAQLNHILAAYMTADKIKWELMKGVPAKGKAELVQKITTGDVLGKINANLFTQFEAMLAPLVGEDSKALVLKFLRKSKEKNFPRLADRKLDWNPFIAAEDDKALVAKIVFSKWEKDNGFDSNAQSIEGSDADAADLAAQAEAANAVFN